MAEIRTFIFARHLSAEPTAHVMLFRNGRKRRSGRGLAFWFLPLGSTIVEVPLDDRELPFVFAGRSSDFQDVAVNAVVTYRARDPERLASRIGFSIDTATGVYITTPLDKLAQVVTELAQQLASTFLNREPLRAILDQGIGPIRDAVHEGLVADPGLASLGIEIVATRVASVKPTAEIEKALQMPARERIQQEADEATFARRALAVEKERAIQENELQNQIELARREETLITQRGQNERRRAAEAAEAKRIEAEGTAETVKLDAAAEAERIRLVEASTVNAERERMEVYRRLPPGTLLGLAAREAAAKLGSIEHVNLSPDLFGPLLQRVLSAGATRLEQQAE